MANVTNLFGCILYADDTTLSSILISFKSNLTTEGKIIIELDKISE